MPTLPHSRWGRDTLIDFTDPRLLGFAIGIVILLIVALFVLTSRRRRLEQRYLAELKDR